MLWRIGRALARRLDFSTFLGVVPPIFRSITLRIFWSGRHSLEKDLAEVEAKLAKLANGEDVQDEREGAACTNWL
jgi:hypothetical protein